MDIYTLTTQEILERISRHCPSALGAYIQCMNRADDQGNIFFTRQMIDIHMSEDWHRFRNHIKALARENLLEWMPLNDGLSVTLAVIDE